MSYKVQRFTVYVTSTEKHPCLQTIPINTSDTENCSAITTHFWEHQTNLTVRFLHKPLKMVRGKWAEINWGTRRVPTGSYWRRAPGSCAQYTCCKSEYHICTETRFNCFQLSTLSDKFKISCINCKTLRKNAGFRRIFLVFTLMKCYPIYPKEYM